MEDKCFQEDCQEAASLSCKCTESLVGMCELHFLKHIKSTPFADHSSVVLRISVDSEDSQEIINVLESQKKNIYESIENLTQLVQRIHSCVQNESAKALSELKKREQQIQDLIELVRDLKDLRTNEENRVLCDLFSVDPEVKASRLKDYEELSKLFDVSNFKKSLDELLDESSHLNYSGVSRNEDVYYFSKLSNALVTYDLPNMQTKEKALDGEFLEASMICPLPDERLLCCNKQKYFIFDLQKNAKVGLGSFNCFTDPVTFVDDGVVYFFTNYNEQRQDGLCIQLNLETLRCSQEYSARVIMGSTEQPEKPKTINFRRINQNRITLVKFKGDIYAANFNSPYVYKYSQKKCNFIQFFNLRSPDQYKSLFQHKNTLYLLQGPNLYYMDSKSSKFILLKPDCGHLSIANLYCTKEIGNSLYFCYRDEKFYRLNLDTYEITQLPFGEART